MLVRIEHPEVVGPLTSNDELAVVARDAASPRTPRGGVLIRPDDFNPERMILDDTIAEPPEANVGDRLRARRRRRGLLVRQLQVRGHVRSGADRPRAAARGHAGAALERAGDRLDERREPRRRLTAGPGEGRAAREHRRRQPALARTSWASRRCRTTTARPTTAPPTRRDVRGLHRRDRGGRRPALRVPPDRPGEQPGRRRAGRQHPRRLPVPHRPRAQLRRPAGRHRRRTATTEDPSTPGAQLTFSPGRVKPDGPGVGEQPQAARRRVPLARQARVRDREPLQLQGRRPAAVRALPAARALVGGAAARAGDRAARVHAQPAARRSARADRGDGRLQRLRLLGDAADRPRAAAW